jgi:hypothetical protein
MDPIEINYWAVLVAALINMVIGMLWYSKLLFGSTWLQAINKSEAEIKASSTSLLYLTSTVSALIMAFVLAHILSLIGANDLVAGIEGAFWLWLGFVFTTNLVSSLFEGKSKQVYWIYVSYQLVSLLIMSVVLTLWK